MTLLKYGNYKDSGAKWVGRIPAHWVVVPLKRMLDIQNGADHKTVESTEGFPVIGSGGPFTFATEFLYDGESVLLGRKGTIDKPLHVNGRFWTVDTMYWSKILPGTWGRFAYYLALTIPFSYYSTSTALPSMTKSVLDTHLVACPPIDEQTDIAAFLDRETAKIDAVIAEQEKLIALLAEKRQATITHAVTKGLNSDAPMKDSAVAWLSEVPVHWDVKKLRYIANVVRGASPRPAGDPRFFASDNESGVNCPWVTVAEVTKDENILLNEVVEYLTPVGVEHSQPFGAGTLIFTNSGATLGVPKILAIDCCANDGILAFRKLSNKVNIRFFYYFLLTTTERLRTEMKQGGGQPNLNTGIVKEISLALPPNDEQLQVVNYLEAEILKLDSLRGQAERAISLLKERRGALIVAAVTGQFDARAVVSPVVVESRQAIAA